MKVNEILIDGDLEVEVLPNGIIVTSNGTKIAITLHCLLSIMRVLPFVGLSKSITEWAKTHGWWAEYSLFCQERRLSQKRLDGGDR